MIYYLTDRTLERAIERCSNDNYNYLIVLKDNKDFDETSVSILEQAMMNDTYWNTSSYLTYDRISFTTGTITIYKDSLITNDFRGVYDEILVDELVEDSKWEILAKHTNRHGAYKEKYKSKEELSFA